MNLRLLSHTRPLTDPAYRLLHIVDLTTPCKVDEHRLSVADLATMLPPHFDGVRRCLAELEWHGWIRRRRQQGSLCIELLYRRPDWRPCQRIDARGLAAELSRAM